MAGLAHLSLDQEEHECGVAGADQALERLEAEEFAAGRPPSWWECVLMRTEEDEQRIRTRKRRWRILDPVKVAEKRAKIQEKDNEEHQELLERMWMANEDEDAKVEPLPHRQWDAGWEGRFNAMWNAGTLGWRRDTGDDIDAVLSIASSEDDPVIMFSDPIPIQ